VSTAPYVRTVEHAERHEAMEQVVREAEAMAVLDVELLLASGAQLHQAESESLLLGVRVGGLLGGHDAV